MTETDSKPVGLMRFGIIIAIWVILIALTISGAERLTTDVDNNAEFLNPDTESGKGFLLFDFLWIGPGYVLPSFLRNLVPSGVGLCIRPLEAVKSLIQGMPPHARVNSGSAPRFACIHAAGHPTSQ